MRMLLSQAILEGIKYFPRQAYMAWFGAPGEESACAMGCALAAEYEGKIENCKIRGGWESISAAIWPYADQRIKTSGMQDWPKTSILEAVQHLNDYGRKSREQIALWVLQREIELGIEPPPKPVVRQGRAFFVSIPTGETAERKDIGAAVLVPEGVNELSRH